MPFLKKHSMESASSVADKAAAAIEVLLKKQPRTLEVINVENDPFYRQQDVDLLWKLKLENGDTRTVKIEVKGDRYYNTGNYFFETLSNEGKGTPGCFLYTQADYIYYYFVEERELHVLPMPVTKIWFLENLCNFREMKTSTPVGNNGDAYVTVGRLVPRKRVVAEVPGIIIKQLPL